MNPYDAFIAQWQAASVHAAEAMRDEADRIIAASRKSTQPRLREVLSDVQYDADEEREYGWALDYEDRT